MKSQVTPHPVIRVKQVIVVYWAVRGSTQEGWYDFTVGTHTYTCPVFRQRITYIIVEEVQILCVYELFHINIISEGFHFVQCNYGRSCITVILWCICGVGLTVNLPLTSGTRGTLWDFFGQYTQKVHADAEILWNSGVCEKQNRVTR